MIATPEKRTGQNPRASLASVRKKVTVLLGDRSTFMAAFGGAMPPDEGHLRSASYGPGGLIHQGTAFGHLTDEQGGEYVGRDENRRRPAGVA